MKPSLLFLILSIQVISGYGQLAESYADANSGILGVSIDSSSDSAYLRSFIGDFDNNDLARIKTFLGSSYVEENRDSVDKFGYGMLMDTLSNILGGESFCKLTAADTSVLNFQSELEQELLLPLIRLVEEIQDFPCQMIVSPSRSAANEKKEKK